MNHRDDQGIHDIIVHNRVLLFEGYEYTDIKADIEGYPPPEEIEFEGRNYIPDVTCNDKNGVFIILEVETAESIDDDHTQNQWRCFENETARSGGEFHIAVPEGSLDAVIARLRELDLHVPENQIHEVTV